MVTAFASGYVNANNIGLPVAIYVLGSATYPAPVILLQLLVFAPAGLVVLEHSRGGGSRVADRAAVVPQPAADRVAARRGARARRTCTSRRSCSSRSG